MRNGVARDNIIFYLLNKPEPGLSDCGSIDQLASKFSAFFQDKIRMIQENLTLKADPNYVPEDNPDAMGNKLSVLVPATEDEVRGLINKSPSTSCSLDPVPTWLLKEYLTCLPTNHYKHCQLVNVNRNCAFINEKCARDAVSEEAFPGQGCHEQLSPYLKVVLYFKVDREGCAEKAYRPRLVRQLT